MLSVCAAVTASLDSHVNERLIWLEEALSVIDPMVCPLFDAMCSTQFADNKQDHSINEHATGVMDALTTRLQEAYMQIAETAPADPYLARIHKLVRRTKEVKSMAA